MDWIWREYGKGDQNGVEYNLSDSIEYLIPPSNLNHTVIQIQIQIHIQTHDMLINIRASPFSHQPAILFWYKDHNPPPFRHD